MKIFWRLLIGMLAILMVSFSIFGTILLQGSFRDSLEMEKDSGLEEMRLFQYTFLSSLEGLAENVYSVNDETLRTLSESIGQNISDGKSSFCVYHSDGLGIDSEESVSEELYSRLDAMESDKENCAWQVVQTKEGHVMEALVKMETKQTTYYLGMERNIEYIYQNRKQMYKNYRMALLALTAIGTFFSAVLAMTFTRPISRLSKATQEFSDGNYDRRVEVKGDTELALLMQDFNRMAEQLQTNIFALQEAARRQEEFTGAFAHELKTPVTAITGYGEMLSTMDLSEEERRRAADYIFRESRRLERLAYKMMELIQLGNGQISLGPVDMEQLGEELKRLVEGRPNAEQISYQFCFEKGTMSGDWELLLSLFGNLIDNGRKASPKGGSILVSGKSMGGSGYRVQVTDYGCGMPKEEIPKIVEAFYRIDKSRARKEGGTGLGMAICQRIVSAHHAEWEICSEEGQGTTVTVTFPVMEVQDES
jgi:signal transduction histidine kinase